MDFMTFEIFPSIMLLFFCIDTMLTKTIQLATLSHPAIAQYKGHLDAVYGCSLGSLEVSLDFFARRMLKPK